MQEDQGRPAAHVLGDDRRSAPPARAPGRRLGRLGHLSLPDRFSDDLDRGLEDAHAALGGRVTDDRPALEEAPDEMGELVGVRKIDRVGRSADDGRGDMRELDGSCRDECFADQRVARPDDHEGGHDKPMQPLDCRVVEHRPEQVDRRDQAVVGVVGQGDRHHPWRFAQPGQGHLQAAPVHRQVVAAAGRRDPYRGLDPIGVLVQGRGDDRAAQRVAQQHGALDLVLVHEPHDGVAELVDRQRLRRVMAAAEAG